MDMTGRPGMQIGHGAVDIHQDESICEPGDVPSDLGPPEPHRVRAQGVAKPLGFTFVCRDDEGGETVGDAFCISG